VEQHPHEFWRFGLVVATVGRVEPVLRLMHSLEGQTFRSFELIVVDQNLEKDIAPVLFARPWHFPITHLRVPPIGVSAARNIGWQRTRAQVLVFPDDDCWYPAEYLQHLDVIMRRGAQLATGRAATIFGRTINGRFDKVAGPITRGNVFTRQIEWNMAISADLMRTLDGYDEAISLGSASPWQAGEGYDLILRALAAGARCHYDPALVGHHEELPVRRPDTAMIAKGYAYARGLGFVLRKHGFGPVALTGWLSRSGVNLARGLLRLRFDLVHYFALQALGRWEGWWQQAAGRSAIGQPQQARAQQRVQPVAARLMPDAVAAAEGEIEQRTGRIGGKGADRHAGGPGPAPLAEQGDRVHP
jgi:glycosyltransferase involved in cell wall biosynthesis